MSEDLPLPDFDTDPVESLPPAPTTSAHDAALLAVEARNASVTSQTPVPPLSPLPLPSSDIREIFYVDVPHPGFDARFGAAFRAPFVGAGTLWMVAIALSVLPATFFVFSPRLFILALPTSFAWAAALQAVHFGQAANAGMHDEGDKIQAMWALPARDELSQLGLAFAFSSAALLAPAIAAAHVGKPLLALLSIGGFLLYWPMSLVGVGISGSVMTLFRPVLMLRMIARTFPQYIRVVGVAAALLLPPIALCLLGSGGLRFLGALWLAPALAYASGVLGFMMGCLAATRVEAFRAFRK
ncbi:MAG: hypothetical protein ACI9KE_001041 [Polyangiales bacterium]